MRVMNSPFSLQVTGPERMAEAKEFLDFALVLALRMSYL